MTFLEDEITDKKYQLENIDNVIKKKLQNILKKHQNEKRKMEIRSEAPDLPEVSSDITSTYVLVNNEGIIERKDPTTRGRAGVPWWNFAIRADESVTLVTSLGIASRLDTSFMRDGSTKIKNVVGVVSDRSDLIVALDAEGYAGVVTYKQSQKTFIPVKSTKDIVQVIICVDKIIADI